MITDTDIKKLKGVFATKDDIKGFATKDYLKKFATKDDLKGFATKDDLKKFATKADLKKSEKRSDKRFKSLDNKMDFLADNMMKHEHRLGRIDTKLDKIGDIDGMFKKIMSSLDIHAKNQEEFNSEQAAIHHKLDRHDIWFENLSRGTGIKLAV